MAKHSELYGVLNIDATATQDEIKRAYRRLALQYHPDKNPSGGEMFKRVNAAWEILGDERMRKIYDTYGDMGVELAQEFGDTSLAFLAGPQAESLMTAILWGVSLVIAFLALFPIFVAIRADQVVMWSWGVVFIPVWVVDIIVYLVLGLRYFAGSQTPEPEEEEEDDGLDDYLDDNGQPLSEEMKRKLREHRKRFSKRSDKIIGVKRIFIWTMLVLLQIFITLKLDDAVSWSWFVVFAPWFVAESIFLILNLIEFTMVILAASASVSPILQDPAVQSILPKKLHQKLFLLFWLNRNVIIRVVFMILIALRADATISVSWGVVFIPVYVWASGFLLWPLQDYLARKSEINPEERASLTTSMWGKIVALFIGGTLFFVSIGLFLRRLDSPDPLSSVSVAVILIPVFLVLGLLLCCTCCCLPCLVLLDTDGSNGNPNAPVSFMKRITAPPAQDNELQPRMSSDDAA